MSVWIVCQHHAEHFRYSVDVHLCSRDAQGLPRHKRREPNQASTFETLSVPTCRHQESRYIYVEFRGPRNIKLLRIVEVASGTGTGTGTTGRAGRGMARDLPNHDADRPSSFPKVALTKVCLSHINAPQHPLCRPFNPHSAPWASRSPSPPSSRSRGSSSHSHTVRLPLLPILIQLSLTRECRL